MLNWVIDKLKKIKNQQTRRRRRRT